MKNDNFDFKKEKREKEYLEKLIETTQRMHQTYNKLYDPDESEGYDDWQKDKLSEDFYAIKGLLNQYFSMIQNNDKLLVKYTKILQVYPQSMLEKVFQSKTLSLIEKIQLESVVSKKEETKNVLKI